MTIITVKNAKFEIVAVSSGTKISGNDVDMILFNYSASLIKEEYDRDLMTLQDKKDDDRKLQKFKLMQECIEQKHFLSTDEEIE